MLPVKLQNISQECQRLINNAHDRTISKIYSNFSFYYYHFSSQKEIVSKSFLLNYLRESKFIVYKYTKLPTTIRSFILNKNIINSATSINDAIICIENKLIIIDQIEESIITDILMKTKSAIIDLNQETNAIEETENFSQHFDQIIKENEFIRYTITPIAGYLIRRYYYPSNFFKNSSFFTFNKNLQKTENPLNELFETDDNHEIKSKIQIFKNKLNDLSNNDNKISQNFKFNENDFIELREIYSKQNVNFKLGIHLETLYIFVIKKILPEKMDEYKYEIDFCQNYSHRCLTKFYGFLYNDSGQKSGFVYEFMSNGSLLDLVSQHQTNFNNFFLIMSISRIFEGIEFLHSKKILHRDLSPSNILINHDFLPFVHDFDKAKYIKGEQTSCTFDLGKFLYSSPEQFNGKNISYSTDIYSFGLVVYYLYERKDMIDIKSNMSQIYEIIKKSKSIPKMNSSTSPNIEFLCNSCIKYNPNERMNLNEIRKLILKEIISFNDFKNYLMNEMKFNVQINDIINFIHESILFLNSNQLMLNRFIENIFNIQTISLFHKVKSSYLVKIAKKCLKNKDYLKAKEYFELSAQKDNNPDSLIDLGFLYINGYGVKQNYEIAKKYYLLASLQYDSYALYHLGYIFHNGFGVKQDYQTALKYYELAAQFNDPNALCFLGVFYSKGYGVEKDINKANKYFDLSANQNDPEILIYLGQLYLNGDGVNIDVQKARKYFELAANQNNDEALLNLGLLYLNGKGVDINFQKAREYFELSAKFNNSEALANLGTLYLYGHGVNLDYQKAREYYESSAKLNNPNGLFNLGILYLNGNGVDINFQKAREYFELSAKFNNSEALVNLGTLYLYGHGVNLDYQKAREYYESSAKLNNSNALYNLGILYLNGNGVDINFQKAREYFELSAKQNNQYALYQLGLLYINGQGVEIDFQKAKKYFELSAKFNNSEALVSLGTQYLNGHGVALNYQKAREYYESAAKFNNSNALLNLGNIYFNGYGVEKDIQISKMYYKLSSEQNNSEALLALGLHYLNGKYYKKNYKKAIQYIEKSAKLNNSNALYYLGSIYYDGTGVKQDFIKAKKYLESSAQYKNPNAFNLLGIIYGGGKGVKQDYQIAKNYFELAAQQNNADAYLNLGFLYIKGEGVRIDYKTAKKYIELAADQNNIVAIYNLGFMYFYGCGVEKDYKRAKDYFEKAAEYDNSDALLHLGIIYLYGNDVKQDFRIAKNYFELAAKQNNPVALYNIGLLYLYGQGVEQNFQMAKKYFDLSGQQTDVDIFAKIHSVLLKKNVSVQDNTKINQLAYLTLFQEKYSSDIPIILILYFNYIHHSFNFQIKPHISDIFLELGNLYYEYDVKKARDYYELSSIYFNPIALFNLGNLYFYGQGVKQSYLLAKIYYELSSFKFYHPAYLSLGVIYFNGFGVDKNYQIARYYFELSAQQFNPLAMNNLGNLYLNGLGVDKDLNKAKYFYELSANLNNPFALNSMGFLYLNGIGVTQDFNKAIKFFESASKLNNSYGFFNLGVIYYRGLGVEKDYKKAKDYFELSANLKNSDGLIFLGNLYILGNGVEKDYTKAKECYELSAKLGNSQGLVELGNLYFNGWGCEKDFKKAKELYELSAKQNNSIGLFNLGNLYLNGFGVEKNYEISMKYYELSARLNNSEALILLGNFYYFGIGVKQSYETAKEYYEKSIKLNNSNGLIHMGKLYYFGKGVKQNYEIAKEYFEKSSKQGNFIAMYFLCDYYLNVKKDQNKAEYYLKLFLKQDKNELLNFISSNYSLIKNNENNLKSLFTNHDSNSSEIIKLIYKISPDFIYQLMKLPFCLDFLLYHKNDCNSLITLSLFYHAGFNVKRDDEKAKQYLDTALTKKDDPNISNVYIILGFFYIKGFGTPKDYSKALHYFDLAIKKGNSFGYLNLGYLYMKGIAVKKDINKAIEYFELAIKNNNPNAYFYMGKIYEKGIGVKKNILNAKKYYERGSIFHDSKSQLKLAKLFLYGDDNISKNYSFAKCYLKLSAKNSNPDALFYLGQYYFNIEKNANKSIRYFEKCIHFNFENGLKIYEDQNYYDIKYAYRYNKFKYYAFNNLGLIQLFHFKDIEKAKSFIQEAAYGELPFGQNNLALLYQLYLNNNNNNNIEYFYNKASKNYGFSLSEFNLGYLMEKNNQIDKSIEYYKKASENEDKQILFNKIKYNDKQFEISKIFIICLANLKICQYEFSHKNFSESKKYFCKSFSKIILKDYQFYFEFHLDDIKPFSYLKFFILNFPEFNLFNQDFELPLNINNNNNNQSNNEKINDPSKSIDVNIGKIEFKLKGENMPNDFDSRNELVFDNNIKIFISSPEELFDFIDVNDQFKKRFINEINDIINLMNEILFTPPYRILFGRIKTEFIKQFSNTENINELFYEGIGIDEFHM